MTRRVSVVRGDSEDFERTEKESTACCFGCQLCPVLSSLVGSVAGNWDGVVGRISTRSVVDVSEVREKGTATHGDIEVSSAGVHSLRMAGSRSEVAAHVSGRSNVDVWEAKERETEKATRGGALVSTS